MLTTFPSDATVAHYDVDGRLIGELLHLDGELVEPLTLEPGESLWALIPGSGLFPLTLP